MFRMRTEDKPLRLNGQQIIVPHHPCHLFAVHLHASTVQFCGDPSIAVATTMFQSDLLNQRTHFRLFLCRFPLSQRPVETSATHRYQLTQVLDAQPALQWHQLFDVFVDAFPPEPLRRGRRASTFCKAPFKKSTSIAFSASKRFSWRISFRWAEAWVLGRDATSPGSTASSLVRHL